MTRTTLHSAVLAIVATFAAAIVAAACASVVSEPAWPAQMTIDEYASWCNEARYGAVTPDTTWAEAAALLTETITEFERVAERLPPEQGLAEYHEVMTDALRIMQRAARMDDIAGNFADLLNRDLLNLFNIPEMLELAVRVGIALEGLTPNTRAKLGDGCI